jgi:hypothetical protein
VAARRRGAGAGAGSRAVALFAAVLLVSGCAGQRQAGAGAPAAASTSSPPTTAAALDGCVRAGRTEVHGAPAAVLGSGPAGVVLSNMILGDRLKV